MSTSAKESKSIKELREFLEAAGVQPDSVLPQQAEETIAAKEMNSLSAEATLISLKWPELERVRKDCLSCGRRFLTDYLSVAYCSDKCRALELDRYGLDWSNKTARQRWGGYQPPGLIPPDALEAMAKVLKLAGFQVQGPEQTSSSEEVELVSEPIEPDSSQKENVPLPAQPSGKTKLESLLEGLDDLLL